MECVTQRFCRDTDSTLHFEDVLTKASNTDNNTAIRTYSQRDRGKSTLDYDIFSRAVTEEDTKIISSSNEHLFTQGRVQKGESRVALK